MPSDASCFMFSQASGIFDFRQRREVIIAQAGSKKQKETQFFFSRAECAMLNKTRHENERIDLYCFSQN